MEEETPANGASVLDNSSVDGDKVLEQGSDFVKSSHGKC